MADGRLIKKISKVHITDLDKLNFIKISDCGLVALKKRVVE